MSNPIPYEFDVVRHLTDRGISRSDADLVQRLRAVGIPVIAVGPEDRPRQKWKEIPWNEKPNLQRFVEGDGLYMICGHGVDVVDVDTKVGGSVDALVPFENYGVGRTPSGGYHYLVPSSGLAKISPLEGVGDYCGGRPDGTGRLGVFLPGSVRTKYPAGGYEVEEDWEVERCIRARVDVDLVADLVNRSVRRSGVADADVAWDGTPAGEDEERRAREVLSSCADTLAGMVAGSGREPYLSRVLGLLYRFVGSGALERDAVDSCMLEAVEAQGSTTTEHDATWGRVARGAWAYAVTVGAMLPLVESAGDDFDAVLDVVDEDVVVRGPKRMTLAVTHPDMFDHVAQKFLEALWVGRLKCVGDQMYEWDGHRYAPVSDGDLRAQVNEAMSRCTYVVEVAGADGGKKQRIPMQVSPNVTQVRGVVEKMHDRARVADWVLEGTYNNMWVGSPLGGEGPWVSVRNGLLDAGGRELWTEGRARYFCTRVLPFEYLPEATCERWEHALQEWFPNDPQAQETLEEMLAGWVLRVFFGRVSLLRGRSGSGKSLLVGLAQWMVGDEFAPTTLKSLGSEFGLSSLVGKSVISIPEAVSGSLQPGVAENLKSITGGDTMVVHRKNRSDLAARFNAHVVVTGNNTLELNDPSGAIAGRFVVLDFKQVFRGTSREDGHLADKLQAEAPGIFNRLLLAYDRLTARGFYQQPVSGMEALEEMRSASNPTASWVDERVRFTDEVGAFFVSEDLMSEYASDHQVSPASARKRVAVILRERGAYRARKDVDRQEVWCWFGARLRNSTSFDTL